MKQTYTDGETNVIGKLVCDDESSCPAPGVLVVPAFGGWGRLRRKARELASQGWRLRLTITARVNGPPTVLKLPCSWEGSIRIGHCWLLSEIKSLDLVGADRIGAMGFCLVENVFSTSRAAGRQFVAAVSIHGVYDPPEQRYERIEPAVLILHGWDDPLAQPPALLQLAQELTETCTDWQVLAFGHTGHPLTTPNAQQPEQGMLFNAAAAARSWSAVDCFFDEYLRCQK